MRRCLAAGLFVALVTLVFDARAGAPVKAEELLQQPSMSGWTTLESTRLRFHFPPDSSVKHRDGYAREHEAALGELLSWFGGDLSGKVDFFVWNDDAQAQPVLGRALAFAVPDSLLVHTSPGHTRGHELTHIVVGDLLKPTASSRFIGEGTAVALDRAGRDLPAEATAAVRAAGSKPVSVIGLWGLEDGDDAVIYPVGGAFVTRLIADGGKERFLALLRAPTLARAREIYGADLDTIVTTFDKQVGIDPAAETLAGLRLRARDRMSKDKAIYSPAELAEIESIYKRGSMKTDDGRKAYADLVLRFPKSNRAGCAALYLARVASGADRTAKLERAAAEFDDTWYGDGTQVGP